MSWYWAVLTLPLLTVFSTGAVFPPSSTAIRPVFQPPNWVFPVAWTYITTAFGYVTAQYLEDSDADTRRQLVAFYATILLGLVSWLPVNYYKFYKLAFGLIILSCWLSIAYLVYLGRLRDTHEVWVLLPLPFWLVVASCLNGVILQESMSVLT